jgi:hypothetical protein
LGVHLCPPPCRSPNHLLQPPEIYILIFLSTQILPPNWSYIVSTGKRSLTNWQMLTTAKSTLSTGKLALANPHHHAQVHIGNCPHLLATANWQILTTNWRVGPASSPRPSLQPPANWPPLLAPEGPSRPTAPGAADPPNAALPAARPRRPPQRPPALCPYTVPTHPPSFARRLPLPIDPPTTVGFGICVQTFPR